MEQSTPSNNLALARAAKAEADAARVAEDRGRWVKWCEWCSLTAAAYGALQRDRNDITQAHYNKVLRQIPPIPRGPKPEDL